MAKKRVAGWSVLAAAGMLCAPAWGGRPLAVDDADPVAPGLFELEAGGVFERDPGCEHWDFPLGLAAGLIPGLEAGLGFGGQFEERDELLVEGGPEHRVHEDGIGDLYFGAKWQFPEFGPHGARHALAGAVKLPTADEDRGLGSGRSDQDIAWIVSRAFGGRIGLHLNLGFSWIGGGPDVVHGGLAVDRQIMESLQWVGEVFTESAVDGDPGTVVQFNTGFRWSVTEDLILDLAAGSKIHGEAPDFMATAGLTWTFGGGRAD